LFAAEALDTLGRHFVERRAIRDALLVAQRAVKETISSRGDMISEGAIDEAVRYWADARP